VNACQTPCDCQLINRLGFKKMHNNNKWLMHIISIRSPLGTNICSCRVCAICILGTLHFPPSFDFSCQRNFLKGLLLIAELSFYAGISRDRCFRDTLQRCFCFFFFFLLHLGNFKLGREPLCKCSEVRSKEYTMSPASLLAPQTTK